MACQCACRSEQIVSLPDADRVVEALRGLGDSAYQERVWGRVDPRTGSYDDLSLAVHILYDDCQVLPDPTPVVDQVVLPGEVACLRALGAVLGPVIDDLGDAADKKYLADPRWPAVVAAAARAHALMSEERAAQ